MIAELLLIRPKDGWGMAELEVGFDADIRPLFREKDRDSMLKAFDL